MLISMLENTLKECDKPGINIIKTKKTLAIEGIHPEYFDLTTAVTIVDYSEIWESFRSDKDIFRTTDITEEEQMKFILALFLILVTAVNEYMYSMGMYADEAVQGADNDDYGGQVYIDLMNDLKYTLGEYFIDTDVEILQQYTDMVTLDDVLLMYSLTDTNANILPELTRIGECRVDKLTYNIIYKFDISSDLNTINCVYH